MSHNIQSADNSRAISITETDKWGRVLHWYKRNDRYYREILNGLPATTSDVVVEVSEHVYRAAAKRFADRGAAR